MSAAPRLSPIVRVRRQPRGSRQRRWAPCARLGPHPIPLISMRLMGAPVSGQCRLCLQAGVVLLDGHIVPAWGYRRIMSDIPRPAQPVLINKKNAVLTDKQLTEHMMCAPCEQRLSIWDKYASQMLVQEDRTFPWLDGCELVEATGAGGELGCFDSSALDTSKLALFATSVCWRASVSRIAIPKVSFGPYEEGFRRHLLGEAPFPERASLIVYIQTAPKGNMPSADRMISMPVQGRAQGCDQHWFLLCGASFHLFVGNRIPALFARHCFVRSQHVFTSPADDIVRRLRQSVHESKARGKLKGRVAR